MSYRSSCLTTRLFLGHPPRIKRPPNVSSLKRECFRVDLKQMMFFFLVLKLHCCFTLLCLFLNPVIYCGTEFVQKSQYHNNTQKALTQCPRQMLLIRHLNYTGWHCCHSYWCVWTRNEASTHVTLAEMTRHTHAVCVQRLTHTATRTLRPGGSFFMHSQGALLCNSCGGLLTPRSPMWLWLS